MNLFSGTTNTAQTSVFSKAMIIVTTDGYNALLTDTFLTDWENTDNITQKREM